MVLRIIKRRLETKAEEFLRNDQFGFRKERGTREAIGVMRCLVERGIEFNKDRYVCFVDYEKAFDRVDWEKLTRILEEKKVDWRDRRMIAELYIEQTAVVRINSEVTEPCLIGRGVKQGCLISPVLFNLYAEAMMKKALHFLEEGVKVEGVLIKTVKFADDQAMVA